MDMMEARVNGLTLDTIVKLKAESSYENDKSNSNRVFRRKIVGSTEKPNSDWIETINYGLLETIIME